MTLSRKTKIDELIKFDKKYTKTHLLIGTDEAGRGPVAGPVTASAVCFKAFNKEVKDVLKYLDDSKKISAKTRAELAVEIKRLSYFSIQECSVAEIEQYNILQASLIAMGRACRHVLEQVAQEHGEAKNPMTFVDGKFIIKNMDFEQQALVKGDSKSASIAAASVLAKVSRDELMIKLSQEFPMYDWQKNKGYGTPAHLQAIREHGQTIWHRKSFLTKCL